MKIKVCKLMLPISRSQRWFHVTTLRPNILVLSSIAARNVKELWFMCDGVLLGGGEGGGMRVLLGGGVLLG